MKRIKKPPYLTLTPEIRDARIRWGKKKFIQGFLISTILDVMLFIGYTYYTNNRDNIEYTINNIKSTISTLTRR